jgi:pimeloyl-ACP methyl ester carboxylesterase
MLVLYILIILCLLITVLWFIPSYTSPIKDRYGKPLKGSIASLESLFIGKVKQWILIRGKDFDNPVLLFLHGGPGTSEMCLLREYTAELEKDFVVVTWDQRSAGKSFAAKDPATSMNIDTFVSDTHELTNYLLYRFNKEKIFLMGHSWGTVVGVLTVQNFLHYTMLTLVLVRSLICSKANNYLIPGR